jgi:hypothetical protein
MSGVNGVGSGSRQVVFSDPMMEVQALAIEDAQHDRSAAKEERRAAQSERDSHFDRSINEERAAAVARLVGGVVGAGAKIAQGASTVASAAHSHQAGTAKAEREHSVAARSEQSSAAADSGQRLTSAQHHTNGHTIERERTLATSAAQHERASNDARAVGEFAGGVGQVGSTGAEFVADSHRIAGKQAEREADRARERAEDARERAQGSGELAGRMLGRVEELARAQRQAEDQRIANIRG